MIAVSAVIAFGSVLLEGSTEDSNPQWDNLVFRTATTSELAKELICKHTCQSCCPSGYMPHAHADLSNAALSRYRLTVDTFVSHWLNASPVEVITVQLVWS